MKILTAARQFLLTPYFFGAVCTTMRVAVLTP